MYTRDAFKREKQLIANNCHYYIVKVIISTECNKHNYSVPAFLVSQILKFQCPIRLIEFINTHDDHITKVAINKSHYVMDLSVRAAEVTEFFFEHKRVMSNEEFINRTNHIMNSYGDYRQNAIIKHLEENYE